MNRNRYRLVFDHERGMLVPVCEHMKSFRKSGASAKVSAASSALALSLGLGLSTGMVEPVHAAPLARTAAVNVQAITRPQAGYVPPTNAFTPTADGSYWVNGAYGQIDQAVQRAVFNWNSFNIGRGGRVHFNQPAGGSALNRIGGTDPSVIDGQLTATGQIYLINQNGILFGGGSQVDVGGMVASTLNITDAVFKNGLLSLTAGQAAFNFGGTAEQYNTSFVRVENGATLNTQNGGSIFMFAPRVENAGSINTPQGQAMLAAGAKVYLAAPLDTRLRGFLVEVDPFVGVDANSNPVNVGGSVSVEQAGEIVARRGGNITLAGLAVNHAGRLVSSTTVDANGSVFIQARDTRAAGTKKQLDAQGNEVDVATNESSRGGEAVLAASSLIQIDTEKTYSADENGVVKERLTSSKLIKSEVSINGGSIILEGNGSSGAKIIAKSGNVELNAYEGQWLDAVESSGHIFLGSGSRIDVSGQHVFNIPISRNIVELELRGDEFKDNPLLRNGPLKGKKVSVDVRKGTKIADISGYTGKIERSVEESSSEGGKVRLRSDGDIIVQNNATIDISGGSVNYDDGYIGVTRLYWRGGGEMIENARLGRIYDKAFNFKRFERGYLEGKNAGSAGFYAPHMLVAGNIVSEVSPGPYQRTPAQRPLGGSLDFAFVTFNVNASANTDPWIRASMDQAVRISAGQSDLTGRASEAIMGAGETLNLWSGMFATGGVKKLSLQTDQALTVDAGASVTMQTGGNIELKASSIDLAGQLTAQGGGVALSSTGGLNGLLPGDITVEGNGGIDVSGTFTNDYQRRGLITTPIVNKGGSISLKSANNLSLATGSILDVSGGAAISKEKGKRKVELGDAGSISLSTGRLLLAAADDSTATLSMQGELRAFATSDDKSSGKGGKLTVSTSSVTVGGAASGRVGELHLESNFFAAGGFKDYDISGADGLSVADNTRIAIAPQTRSLTTSALKSPSLTAMDAVTNSKIMAPEAAAPGSVRFAATRATPSTNGYSGDLSIGRNAVIEVSAGRSDGKASGGSITLDAGHQLVVAGELRAKGGNIAVNLAAPDPNLGLEYDATRALWLTDTATIDASGSFVRDPKVKYHTMGEVLNGGKITLNAASGYLVTQSGANINASGIQAVLEQRSPGGPYQASTVASAGGSIGFSAYDGMLLEGNWNARAGNAGMSGGHLSFALNRLDNSGSPHTWVAPPADADRPRQITLAATSTGLTSGLTPGSAIDTATHGGQALVSAERIRNSGADSLSIQAQNAIALSGNADLALARSITLDAPNLVASPNSDVRLTAAYVSVGNSAGGESGQRDNLRAAASGGTGKVSLFGRLIDLIGNVSVQGAETVNLTSSGDVRMRGVAVDTDADNTVDTLRGELATGGNLNIAAAQIYPSTLTDFTLDVQNNATGTVTISQNGSPGDALSAGGKLTINAPNIVQGGTVKAPFGSIALNASETTRADYVAAQAPVRSANGSVVLTHGSLTSVSGDGLLVPFGRTDLSGRDWLYSLADGISKPISVLPDKQIVMTGAAVNTQSGAKVDISGGGDLKAWEFAAGRGGSRDVLDAATNPNTFAIVPNIGTAYAPFDQQAAMNGTLKAGDRITLQTAANGLAAGEYTLLPARYALMPGAFMVTFTGTALNGVARPITQRDQSVLTSAVRSAATNTGSVQTSSRIEQVEIASGDIVRARSGYSETLASQFFAGKPESRQTGDAGRLAIEATNQITLDASFGAAHAVGYRGAEVDLASQRLAVIGNGQTAVANAVNIDLAKLNQIGAESILLGGRRTEGANGTTINVFADSVDLKTGSSESLRAAEIMAAAKQTLTVHADSRLDTNQSSSTTASKKLLIDGNGSLLRVANGPQLELTRSNVDTSVAALLDVQTGSRLSGQSVILDSSKNINLNGDVILPASGGALALGAARIALGSNVGDGVALANPDIAKLGSPSDVRLTSYSTIDLYGGTSFGSLQNGAFGIRTLTLQVAGIAGYDNSGQTATLQAETVRLQNPNGTAFAPAGVNGTGTLNITGNTVVFGDGMFATEGFGQVNANAGQEIRLAGQGLDSNGTLIGHQIKGGALNLSAPRIAADKGATQALVADGVLTTTAVAATTATSTAAGQGTRIKLAGSQVVHNGRIDLPSGDLTLAATGSNAGDSVTLGAGSEINASGYARDFAGTMAAASAGNVTLSSANGNVTISASGAGGAAAKIDVSGTAGGDAGSISINAGKGTLAMNGDLRGSASTPAGGKKPRQGSFSADANALGDVHALNVALETGGFTESRNFRQRSGDIVLGQSGVAQGSQQTYTAYNFKASADAGNLTVYNKIDASGGKGGRIELYGKNNVVLESTSTLNAQATDYISTQNGNGTRGQGGDVIVGAGQGGQIHVKDGAQILVGVGKDSTGLIDSAALGGTVNFRAERSAGADVANVFFDTGSATRKLNDTITGAREVAVEAVKYLSFVGNKAVALADITSTNATDLDAGRLGSLATRLGFVDTTTTDYKIRAGVDIRATGNITFSGDLDLKALRYGDAAGVLTVRAAGNLTTNTLSDGFSTATTTGTLNTIGDSWSYRLVAGADLAAANPLGTIAVTDLAAGTGNLTIGASKLVRTGTGSIDLAAGRDIVLANQASAVYTAGYADQSVDHAVIKLAGKTNPSNREPEFGKRGGDLRLLAGEDIVGTRDVDGTTATNSSQWLGEWLYRIGALDADGTYLGSGSAAAGNQRPTLWWSRFDQFKQGFATLGGGDINATAGSNIVNSGFSAPTNGRLPGTPNDIPDRNNLVVQGGGDVLLKAGGNLDSVFVLQEIGEGRMDAGGKIGSKHTVSGVSTYSSLALGDVAMLINSRGDATLERVFNFGLSGQTSAYAPANNRASYFSTYGENSAINLHSTAGNITLNQGNKYTGGLDASDAFLPGTLLATALGGDINIAGALNLAPTPKGQLELLAGDNVVFVKSQNVTGSITMLDTDPDMVARPWSPVSSASAAKIALPSGYSEPIGAAAHSPTVLHKDDSKRARIVAAEGDITGNSNSGMSLGLAKSAQISAGRDIRNLVFYGQNAKAGDITSISAGRDLEVTTDRNLATGAITAAIGGMWLSGPGRLDIAAGRNIDLGSSKGIITNGNLYNPYLSVGGAAISALAGASSLDYTALNSFFNSASAAAFSGLAQQAYDSVVLPAMIQHTGNPNLDAASARLAFAALTAEERNPLLRDALFATLAKSGSKVVETYPAKREYYGPGYSALAAAFPGTPSIVPSGGNPIPTVPYQGDINLYFSQIVTEQGGGIDLFAPGGKVNVGLANAGKMDKPPYELGIRTLDTGNIRSYSLGNFDVNQSRTFTMGGGDIVLWSSYGDIDAGNGKKSASAAPPPIPRWNPLTQSFVLDISNSVSGSGIGVILGKPGVTGTIYAFAPNGAIIAGDGGFKAPKIEIGGNTIIGADNIRGGVVVGAPPPPPAPPPNLGSVAGAATETNRTADKQAAADAANRDRGPQSILNIEILSMGE